METLKKCLFLIRILFKVNKKGPSTRKGLFLQIVTTIRKKKMKKMRIRMAKRVFDGTLI